MLESRLCSQPWGEQTPSDVLLALECISKGSMEGPALPQRAAMRGWAAREILNIGHILHSCFEKEHKGQRLQEGETVSTEIPHQEAARSSSLSAEATNSASCLSSASLVQSSPQACPAPSCQLLKHCGPSGNGNGRFQRQSVYVD